MSSNKTYTKTKFGSKKELYDHILNVHDRQSLPLGWKKVVDPREQVAYYDNEKTLERSFEYPGQWWVCPTKCGLPYRFRLCDKEAEKAHLKKGCMITKANKYSVPPMADKPANRRLIERFIRESI